MRKFTTFISAIFVFTLVLASCNQERESGIRNEVITSNNLDEIVTKIESDETMDNEEIQEFYSGLARMSNTNDTIVGKTVGQIIDAQDNFNKTASVKNLRKTAANIQMNMAHDFMFQQLTPVQKGEEDYNVAVFQIKNISDKDIKELHGIIQLYNKQNQLVKIYTVDIKDGINKGETKKYTRPYPNDPNNQYDVAVRAGNLRPVWAPKFIEFADGKTISSVPQKNTDGTAVQ